MEKRKGARSGGRGFAEGPPPAAPRPEAERQRLADALAYRDMAAHCGLQSRWAEAIAFSREALRLNPNDAEAHNNLALALEKLGDVEAAIAAYRQALRCNPGFPEAHNNLGVALRKRGDLAGAIAAYGAALQLRPSYPQAQNNLGNALLEQGDLEAAIAAYHRALRLKADYPSAHYNLGAALQRRGEPEAAIHCYQRALQLQPDYPEAQLNLGNAWQELGDLQAALAAYQAAAALRPEGADALYNQGMTLLLAGDYRGGWEHYERRFQSRSCQGTLHAQPQCPRWDGGPLQAQEPLLLVGEQGLGDTLQFMRYALTLRERGVAVSLCAHPKLHGLIQASGIDAAPLTPQQGNAVIEGRWLPLLSLPRHLEVSPGHAVISEPYIRCPQELIAQWRTLQAAEGGLVVGLNWQGNPAQETSQSQGRSLPLEALAPLARLDGVRFVSLQKGEGSEQLEGCSFRDRFVGCQERISATWDFVETAAIIAACDLVITSDTAVAHLAGGLGQPTWLLLKQVPEWRWGLEGERTFWYPSVRLFRQRRRGDWAELLERVAAAMQHERLRYNWSSSTIYQ